MLPDRLSEFERRLAAFVRAMLAEPEIMVYDGLFDGLTRVEIEKAMGFDRLFRLRPTTHRDLRQNAIAKLVARIVSVMGVLPTPKQTEFVRTPNFDHSLRRIGPETARRNTGEAKTMIVTRVSP